MARGDEAHDSSEGRSDNSHPDGEQQRNEKTSLVMS
jgi:hypothetical protein